MFFDPLSLCRLCMKESHQNELYKIEDAALDPVIFFCVDIKIQPGDGLPQVICLDCLTKIRMFYSFKRVCLEVDFRLKTVKEKSKLILDTTNVIKAKELYESNEKKMKIYNKNSPKKDQDSRLRSNNKINLSGHIKKINNFNNSYQCEQCGRTFKLKTILEKHMTVHTGIKPYICKLCHKGFTRAANRMIHMRSHLGIKPFICEICGRTSTKRSDLIRHMKIHSDERNYSCSLCGRKFKRSFDVYNHMRTHTGLRQFMCNICEKTYTSQSGLQKHYKNHCKKDSNQTSVNSLT